jgi:hypothetical protein
VMGRALRAMIPFLVDKAPETDGVPA